MALHRETSDGGRVLRVGVGLIVVAAVVSLMVWRRVPPETRLEVKQRQEMSDLRAKEDQVLGSYGWVDRNAGVVRIPIVEAVKLTLEQGLPARQDDK